MTDKQADAVERDETLFAWTSLGDYRYYPQFVNISRKDGRVVITVRSPEDVSGEHFATGAYASVTLPDEEVAKLVAALTLARSNVGVEKVRDVLESLTEAARNARDARRHPPLTEALFDADNLLSRLPSPPDKE